MILLHERALFQGEMLEVELHDDLSYRLRFSDQVEYSGGEKRIRDRIYPYLFRSVEQLRYDFERDVAALGGRLA
jgi:hypothetical protein